MIREQKTAKLLDAIIKHKSFEEIAESVGLSLDEARKIISNLKSLKTRKVEDAVLIVDGSSKGNPGPAGAGIVLCDSDGNEIDSLSVPLGVKTNNEAEYLALIAGLKRAKELGISRLKVISDSELLIKQMRGEYQIKSKKILPLVFKAARLRKDFLSVTFELAERSHTKCADKLARTAANLSESGDTSNEKR